MDFSSICSYMNEYGVIFLFVIVLLEYMNLPGLPAGIILPFAGVWCRSARGSFITVIILTVVAGTIGTMILYYISSLGYDVVIRRILNRFPKQKDVIESKAQYLREKGATGVFIGRLLPAVRTLIAIPAGMIKMNTIKFFIYSIAGITIWNTVFISMGYILGEKIIAHL